MSSGIQMRKETYRKANWALGISAVGLISAFPFQGAFWGGLLTSGCSAALVGGLADWFAVNALFRRPLGIRPGRIFRTEIIPRNRERIYSALSDMVQNELLSQEALKGKLKAYDFSAPLIQLWEAQGRQALEFPMNQLLQQVLPGFALEIKGLEAKSKWQGALEEERVYRENVAPFLEQVLASVLDSNEGKKALETMLQNVCEWVRGSEAHLWLVHWLENSITRYVNENPSRKFLVMFLPEPNELAHKLQNQLEEYILGSVSKELPAWLKKKAGELLLSHAAYLTGLIKQYFQQGLEHIQKQVFNQDFAQSDGAAKLSRFLLAQLEAWVAKLKANPEEGLKLNAHIQSALITMVESQHERIGRMVREGLEKYSDDMLVELIESKTGEDLQMIRINGSVVGGLAGMLIYLVNWLV